MKGRHRRWVCVCAGALHAIDVTMCAGTADIGASACAGAAGMMVTVKGEEKNGGGS